MNTGITAVEFGRAIAATNRVQLWTGGNDFADSASFPDAEPTVPWAVRVADRAGFRTLAADFDTAHGDAVGDAKNFAAILTSCEIHCVPVVSGPTHGRHVLATFNEPVEKPEMEFLRAAALACFSSLDPSSLQPAQAIRPPGSLHRIDGRSRVIGGEQVALRFLTEGNDPRLVRRVTDQLARLAPSSGSRRSAVSVEAALSRLSDRTRDLLVNGTKQDGDASRSGVQWSAMLGAVAAGLDRESTFMLLQHPEHQAGARLRERCAGRGGVRRERRRFEQEWDRAERWLSDHAPIRDESDALVELRTIADAVERAAWRGQARGTDRAAIEAMLATGIRTRRLIIGMSCRELAEQAKMTPKTARRALQRLRHAGWIELLSTGSGLRASEHRLRVPVSGLDPTHYINGGGV